MNRIYLRLSLVLIALLNISLLHAFDGATDQLLTGTVIKSSGLSRAEQAFDGDPSTYASSSSSQFQWVGLDLGQAHVITRISYTPVNNYSGSDRCLLSLFEGANSPDFLDAMPLYLISEAPGKGVTIKKDINVSRGFRYVRYVGGSGSYCNIADLEFYGHAGDGDDSQFYQVTNLPTLSIHVQDNILPTTRGQDFVSESKLIYEGGTMVQDYPIQFRVRGNFSSAPENKAYRIKFDDGKSHHMMKGSPVNESPTKAKKWVLINSYRDKTLMRNPVAWAMAARAEMNWTPWSQVVDLIVNGEYRGTYTLADAVSVNKGRINITEMTEDNTDEETITGGYFVEVDNNASREPYWFTSSHGNPITVHDPDEDVIQTSQFNYIRSAWNDMEGTIFGSSYTDKETGLRSVLDLDSFLKYFLISEFNGNTDMLCQVFFYKERGDDHFYTGPIWDAELALDDDSSVYPGNQRSDWTYPVRATGQFGQFVSRVLSDPSVYARLQEIWAQLRRAGMFEAEDVAADVDSLRREVRASANLNFIRWPYLNQYISLTPAIRGTWEAEVDVVRNYVRDRVAWMDNKLSYGKVRQENGIYQIGSAIDLCTFADMVNGGETDAEAVLVADIDMTEYSETFQPMGSSTKLFTGSLDGQGHTISGLHLSGKDYVGLFSYVGGGTYKNIVFDETCSATGDNYVAMLIGCARTGVVNISGIENHATVTATGNSASALLGYGRLLASVYFTDCSNTAAITATSNAAAIAAPVAGKMSIKNCYSSGLVTGATDMADFGQATKSLTIENCYAVGTTQVTPVTAEQVDNGYLCHTLNFYANNDSWRQNLDNGRKHTPYPVRSTSCGMVYEKDGHYTNINSDAATFRYYNLIITSLQSGSDGTIQFSEFDILDETMSEVTELEIYDGTRSTISYEDWDNLADNQTGTKFCSAFHGDMYFLFDAKSGVDPFGYRIYTANDTNTHPERNPGSWRLYGSNDRLTDPYDSGWVLLDEQYNNVKLGATNYTPYDFTIPHAIRALSVDFHEATLLPGEELQLTATCEPAAAGKDKLQWTSSDETVATVDKAGHVTAVGLGTAVITLSAPNYGTLSDSCVVKVVEERPGNRYYLFAIEAIGGGGVVQLSEFDLLDHVGNEVKPLTMYACTGSYFGDEVQKNLFDDNTATKYCGSFSKSTPTYIYIDAGEEVTISGYRLTTANDTQSSPGRNPKAWSLYGSNEKSEQPGDACWKLLDHRQDDETLKAVNFTPFDFFLDNTISGDVNGDGEVNTQDVATLVAYLLEENPLPFVSRAADMDANGSIDVADLVRLVALLNQ